ncbi:hypothetical protein HG531_005720 [Fusarium graminearum]|nr:hypothetical protein HG531_005720 [Fusarium graminearum]
MSQLRTRRTLMRHQNVKCALAQPNINIIDGSENIRLLLESSARPFRIPPILFGHKVRDPSIIKFASGPRFDVDSHARGTNIGDIRLEAAVALGLDYLCKPYGNLGSLGKWFGKGNMNGCIFRCLAAAWVVTCIHDAMLEGEHSIRENHDIGFQIPHGSQTVDTACGVDTSITCLGMPPETLDVSVNEKRIEMNKFETLKLEAISQPRFTICLDPILRMAF